MKFKLTVDGITHEIECSESTYQSISKAIGDREEKLQSLDTALVDVDTDGFVDLITSNRIRDSISVYTGDGNGGFPAETIYSVGGDEPAALHVTDLNGDGVLDLLLTRAGEPPALYLSQGCTAAGWLAVEAPIGSRVQVEAGGVVQTAWVVSDPGFAAAKTPEVWFGLGDTQGVERLVVTLPWDQGTIEAADFDARRRIVVTP